MSFWRLYYHLVWATRIREPVLTEKIEAALYPFLVSKAAKLGVFVYAVGGIADHVHMVVAIPPDQAVTIVVKELKGASSHYLNLTGLAQGVFVWQRGYGALSVGERHRAQAEAYVAHQKEHHAAQNTNTWLERCAEYDEGPQDHGIAAGASNSFMREPAPVYEDAAPWPF